MYRRLYARKMPRNFSAISHKKMLGSKAPNHDAYGLFRALHSHNPTQGLSTTYEQAHVVLDLLTLAS